MSLKSSVLLGYVDKRGGTGQGRQTRKGILEVGKRSKGCKSGRSTQKHQEVLLDGHEVRTGSKVRNKLWKDLNAKLRNLGFIPEEMETRILYRRDTRSSKTLIKPSTKERLKETLDTNQIITPTI